MDFLRSHRLIVATIVIQIIALPLVLLLVKQNQETRTHAAASTILFFNPTSSSSSPIQATIGQNVALDLMLTPANNLISFAKIEINYDPALFAPDPINPVIVNTQAFPVTVEGPVITSGKIQIVVSVGSDQTKVIQTQTRILTLNLKPLSSSNQNASVSIGSTTTLLSIAPQDTSTENVLSSSTPAIVKVSAAPTNSPTPTRVPSTTPTPTKAPTPTPSLSPIPTLTPTPTKAPTPTPMPTTAPSPTTGPTTPTILNFTGLKLHGLGHGGDNPNPTSIGTTNPLRTTRNLTIQLFNGAGALVQSATGTITYTGSSTGLFNGDINIPNTVASGNYTVKITSPTYLTKLIPGFVTLVKGSTTSITPVALIAGDVNGDNQLKVADYDLIMDCYSDLAPAKNCDANKKLAADISDDGKVDQDDYNLFLRELSVQAGD